MLAVQDIGFDLGGWTDFAEDFSPIPMQDMIPYFLKLLFVPSHNIFTLSQTLEDTLLAFGTFSEIENILFEGAMGKSGTSFYTSTELLRVDQISEGIKNK